MRYLLLPYELNFGLELNVLFYESLRPIRFICFSRVILSSEFDFDHELNGLFLESLGAIRFVVFLLNCQTFHMNVYMVFDEINSDK